MLSLVAQTLNPLLCLPRHLLQYIPVLSIIARNLFQCMCLVEVQRHTNLCHIGMNSPIFKSFVRNPKPPPFPKAGTGAHSTWKSPWPTWKQPSCRLCQARQSTSSRRPKTPNTKTADGQDSWQLWTWPRCTWFRSRMPARFRLKVYLSIFQGSRLPLTMEPIGLHSPIARIWALRTSSARSLWITTRWNRSCRTRDTKATDGLDNWTRLCREMAICTSLIHQEVGLSLSLRARNNEDSPRGITKKCA